MLLFIYTHMYQSMWTCVACVLVLSCSGSPTPGSKGAFVGTIEGTTQRCVCPSQTSPTRFAATDFHSASGVPAQHSGDAVHMPSLARPNHP